MRFCLGATMSWLAQAKLCLVSMQRVSISSFRGDQSRAFRHQVPLMILLHADCCVMWCYIIWKYDVNCDYTIKVGDKTCYFLIKYTWTVVLVLLRTFDHNSVLLTLYRQLKYVTIFSFIFPFGHHLYKSLVQPLWNIHRRCTF